MLNNLRLKPQVTEKAFTLASLGKYTFSVAGSASKAAISKAISELFKVNVVSVNIINIKGKVKRTRFGVGKRKDISKAIVTLKKGEKIDIFDTEEQKEDKKVDKKQKETKAEIKDKK